MRAAAVAQTAHNATSPLSGPGLSFFAGCHAFRLPRRTQNVCAAVPSTATPLRRMKEYSRPYFVALSKSIFGLGSGKRREERKKEEGRGKRVLHVRAMLPLLILPGGSSSVRTALLSQQSFRGCSSLPRPPSLSLSLSHTYATSALQPCVIATNRYDQIFTLFETLCAHRSQGARRRDPAAAPPRHVCRAL